MDRDSEKERCFMNFYEIVLTGIGLAMDAFAVSVVLSSDKNNIFCWRKMLLTAFFFGAFQAFMPVAGWLIGNVAAGIVEYCGKFLAAALLGVIGAKMIFDKPEDDKIQIFNLKLLTAFAFATSIDALFVGVSFACLKMKCIAAEVLIIGFITFLIALGGCCCGKFSGKILGRKSGIAGGLVLIGLGLKILIF